ARSSATTLVDHDGAGPRLDADRLQSEVLRPGPPADAEDQNAAAGLAAVVELDHAFVHLQPDRLSALPEKELDSVFTEDLLEQHTDLRILAVGQVRRALHDRDSRAEAGKELGQLDGDHAAADEDDALRDLRHRRRLAVGPVA